MDRPECPNWWPLCSNESPKFCVCPWGMPMAAKFELWITEMDPRPDPMEAAEIEAG